MTFWQKIFRNSVPSADQRYSQLVTVLLHHQRLMGEIILQLPHRFDHQLQATMGLAWAGNQLVIRVNPDRLLVLRQDDAVLMLAHLALHVVWKHPARYTNYLDQELVAVATDIAVNQYLPGTPQGTASLAQLRRVLRRLVPEKLDSQEYLQIINGASQEEREKLLHAVGGTNAGNASKTAAEQPVESHAGWVSGTQINADQAARLAAVNQLVHQAWRQTPQRDRGLLPGEVQAQIERPVEPIAVVPTWQQLLRRQLGKIAQGHQPRANRFNRRQPLRMDLPGQVSRLVPAVHIFVDNSGSVSDEELAAALLAIGQMTGTLGLPAWLYSFDAKVSGKGTRLRPGQAPRLTRQGGGGTQFQCVFDYLRDHRVPKTGTMVIIITDGWGESTLRCHHYYDVFWLLTTKRDQLSVPTPASHVLELRRKQND